jgi:hypothetical protein
VSPHLNGASRVVRVTILSQAAKLEHLTTALSAVLPPADLTSLTAPSGHGHSRSFWIASPAGHRTEILVRVPESEEENAWVRERGEGIYQVTIGTDKRGEKERLVGGKAKLLLTPLDAST